MSPALTEASITAAEYHEKGGDYLKEHCASNLYLPSSDIYAVKQWLIDIITIIIITIVIKVADLMQIVFLHSCSKIVVESLAFVTVIFEL